MIERRGRSGSAANVRAIASTCAQPEALSDRAVVDAVTGGIRLADAEVVVVGADRITTCAASFGSFPGRMPPTLAVCTRESVLLKLREVRTPSDTGLKARERAAAMSLSRS